MAKNTTNGATIAVEKNVAWNNGTTTLMDSTNRSMKSVRGTLIITPEMKENIFSLRSGL
jgi:hypothetical protein